MHIWKWEKIGGDGSLELFTSNGLCQRTIKSDSWEKDKENCQEYKGHRGKEKRELVIWLRVPMGAPNAVCVGYHRFTVQSVLFSTAALPSLPECSLVSRKKLTTVIIFDVGPDGSRNRRSSKDEGISFANNSCHKRRRSGNLGRKEDLWKAARDFKKGQLIFLF